MHDTKTAQPTPKHLTITRYEVLAECLSIYSGIKRSFSRNRAFERPNPGFELAFEAVEKKMALLREMLQEEEFGKEVMTALRNK